MAEVEDKLKDYEIKKEGEAEILLHKKNAVFYNPVQVCSSSVFLVFFFSFFKKRGCCSIGSLSALAYSLHPLNLLVAIYCSDLLTSS